MKKYFYPLMAAALVIAGCAKEYDDSAVLEKIDGLDNRLTQVEADLKKAETNIFRRAWVLIKSRLSYFIS